MDVAVKKHKREQVKQACQRCRRKKTKVWPSPCFHQLVSPNITTQCDEVRPTCQPCMGSGLVCQYELPVGQTRMQALSESQQRLRRQIHSHTSLIQSLRYADSWTSLQILESLRRGYYDKSLSLNDDIPCRATTPEYKVYPWETPLFRDKQRGEHHAEVLPHIDTLVSLQDNDSMRPYPHKIRNTSTHLSGDLSKHRPSIHATAESPNSRKRSLSNVSPDTNKHSNLALL
jgi:hypothetical protein